MPSLDEIKKRKLDELMRLQQEKVQQQSQDQDQDQAQMQQQIEYMEDAVRQFFTKEALARYGNLKTAHQDKALQLLLVLFQAIQKGQIKSKIDDSILKKLLEQLAPKKREMRIKRV